MPECDQCTTPAPEPTYGGHIIVPAGSRKYDNQAPSMPPETAPGYVMQAEDRYPTMPFLPRMPENPCRPCYPPQEYFPSGTAPAQVPEGFLPSSHDWPAGVRCYKGPHSIPLPLNPPETPPCVPPNQFECCAPTAHSGKQPQGIPDCCVPNKPVECCTTKPQSSQNNEYGPSTVTQRRVHFAESAPSARDDPCHPPHNSQACCATARFTEGSPHNQSHGRDCFPAASKQVVPHDPTQACPAETMLPENLPQDPLPPAHPATRPPDDPVCYQPLAETMPATACYRPVPQDAFPSIPPQGPCYCYPPSGSMQPVPPEGPPCYLPQPEDNFPPASATTAEGQQSQQMGPIGPWATGKVDWGPLSGMTGTRPVVDRYSITRFSEGEWRKHNEDVIQGATQDHHHANLVDFNGRRCMEMTAASTDKSQAENTNRLRQRAHEVHHWKCELERAINAMAEEINLVEIQRQRLKTSMGVLRIPEAIAGECLERRTTRFDSDLVRDQPEEELVKEVSLISEVNDLLNRLLKQMEEQLRHDKAIKQRLEMDWSDKKETHDLEAININLKNTSPTILFKPGATRIPEGQSTPQSWEFSTRENLGLLEAERLKSVDLRSYLDKILTDVTRDLRMQADRVDTALSNKIAISEDCRLRLENDLLQILRRIADTEKLISDLKQAIRNQDMALKKAQTRLSNRLLRPRAESCRDYPQYGLIDEVKTITENVAAQKALLQQAEYSLENLITSRGNLEREIMIKRKTLNIDRDRCQEIRAHYPSSVALSGY